MSVEDRDDREPPPAIEYAEAVEVMPVAEHEAEIKRIVSYLRHIDRLSEIPGAALGMPKFNPLWDAAGAIEDRFGPAKRPPDLGEGDSHKESTMSDPDETHAFICACEGLPYRAEEWAAEVERLEAAAEDARERLGRARRDGVCLPARFDHA